MSLVDFINSMKVVTVSGSFTGVGKTLLAEFLLKNIPECAAIKISIDNFYTKVTDDEHEIMDPGKDTYRLRHSGARKVVWVRTTEHQLEEAMEQALAMVGAFPRLLIEGNTILRYLTPSLAFFVLDGRSLKQMKPIRFDALKKANVCVINNKEGGRVNEENLKRITSLNPQVAIIAINLADPLSYPQHEVQLIHEQLKLLC